MSVEYPETKQFDAFRKDYLKTRGEDDPDELEFHGTVKIHGTNITIVYTSPETWTIHSRHRQLFPSNDLYSCYATLSQAPLHELAAQVSAIHPWKQLLLAGEWAGKGIQKHVGVCHLPHLYTIFNLKIDGNWHDIRTFQSVSLPANRIFNICDFRTYTLTVRMTSLEDVRRADNQMVACVEEIDVKCPVAEKFDILGKGEGIVFTAFPCNPSPQLRNFKIKGPSFQMVNSSKISHLPTETAAKISAFVEYAVSDARLDQGMEYLAEMGIPVEGRSTGKYISWVVRDVLKEEGYVIEEMGLGGMMKEVRVAVTGVVREGWKKRLKEAQRRDLEVQDGIESLQISK
jgi:RNA ligase